MGIGLDDEEDVLEQAFAVDHIPSVIREEHAETGEYLVCAQAGPWPGLEFLAGLHRLGRLVGENIHDLAPAHPPAEDHALLLEILQVFVEAYELYVGAAHVFRQGIGIAAVHGVVFDYVAQKHGLLRRDAEVPCHQVDVFLQVHG